MACELSSYIGQEAAVKLSAQFGGSSLYIPKADRPLTSAHPINATLGHEKTRELQELYGGSWLWIPRYIFNEHRNQLIFAHYQAGMSYDDIADRYSLSVRYIRQIISYFSDRKPQ